MEFQMRFSKHEDDPVTKDTTGDAVAKILQALVRNGM